MKTEKEKQEALSNLAILRQKSVPKGYHGIGEYHSGIYECHHVSPYAKTAGNTNAKVMVVLQDFGCHSYFRADVKYSLIIKGYDPKLPTNVSLTRQLKTYFNLDISKAFVTNLFPFVKPSSMNGYIKFELLQDAAKMFTIPQIKIIQPKLVILCGVRTYNAVMSVLNLKKRYRLEHAINWPVYHEGVAYWAQAYPGHTGTNRRGAENIEHDWRRMVNVLIKKGLF